MPGEDFYRLAAMASGTGAQRGQQGMDFLQRAYAAQLMKDENFRRALGEWKQRRAQKKAEEKSTGGMFGKAGAGVGAAAGLALAIPTGGASLAILPALGAAGGAAIGGAFDRGPGQVDYQGLSRGANQLAMMENPLYSARSKGGGAVVDPYNPNPRGWRGTPPEGAEAAPEMKPMTHGQQTAQKVKAKITSPNWWNPFGDVFQRKDEWEA
jgi:hypothetical protein